MSEILVMEKALECMKNNKEVAVATIIAAEGSAPRGVGTTMAVLEDGSICGTIGGGSIEKTVIDLCRESIKKGKSQKMKLSLDEDKEGMICGGEIEVFVQIFNNKPKLIIVGGGHVGYSIYELASLLDFHIVILEDRKEFLTRERFPEADELILGKMKDSIRNYPVDDNTYIVIVTRGHQYDEEVVEVVIDSDAKYIGALGSETKIKTMNDNLKEKGLTQEQLDKIYSPIGLKISGESPAEISVSIIAEILAIKNDGELIHMKDV